MSQPVATRKRVKLSSFTMAFDCLHKAGCTCTVTMIYSAATSSRSRSDRTQHTGMFLLISFMGSCNRSQKTPKVGFVRKDLLLSSRAT